MNATETLTKEYTSLLQRQQAFFATGVTLDTAFRRRQLIALRNALHKHEEDFYYALNADFGKGRFDTYTTELAPLYGEISWQLRNLKRNAKTSRISCNLANLPAIFRLQREPVGCVLTIGAWNYPLHLALMPVVDAIAAGCTVVIKPSELTANISKTISWIINETFHESYLHVVEGGAEETNILINLQWDKIFFTGSPRVGRLVYMSAARNLVPVTLELGGKSPVIVTPHADLALAARRIAWGKCLNAGQTCVAPDYLVVHHSVKDELLILLSKEMSCRHYLPGGEASVNIINDKNFKRLMQLLIPYSKKGEATAHNAMLPPNDTNIKTLNGSILCGGTGNAATRSIAPTLVEGVLWDDPIMQEEIFGPILPVLTYEHWDETLERIALQERPLSAYLFSNNRSEQQQFMQTLHFGGGCINDVMMHLTNPAAPFGGIGNSGIGSYHGKHGFLCFTHEKTIMKKPRLEFPLKYPPYGNLKIKLIKRILK
ncbi:MAG: aldehyde dehydrogenase family protein [Bacteroidales bacterium]|nr:aldehyde dehydrogenase family protein [Bacteroidales bacterium]